MIWSEWCNICMCNVWKPKQWDLFISSLQSAADRPLTQRNTSCYCSKLLICTVNINQYFAVKDTHPCPIVRAAQRPGRRQTGLDVAPCEVVLGLLEGRGGGQADGGGVGQLPRGPHQCGGSSAATVRAGGLVIWVRVETRAGAELRAGAQLGRCPLRPCRTGVSGYDEFRDCSWVALASRGAVGGLIRILFNRTAVVLFLSCFGSGATVSFCHLSLRRRQPAAQRLFRGQVRQSPLSVRVRGERRGWTHTRPG